MLTTREKMVKIFRTATELRYLFFDRCVSVCAVTQSVVFRSSQPDGLTVRPQTTGTFPVGTDCVTHYSPLSSNIKMVFPGFYRRAGTVRIASLV